MEAEAKALMEDFNDFLRNVKNFLIAHPTEVVFTIVSPEDLDYMDPEDKIEDLIWDAI